MQQTRRAWMRLAAAAVGGVGLAGCQGDSDDNSGETPTPGETETPTDDAEKTEDGTGSDGESGGDGKARMELDLASEQVAVTAEWNAIRTRLRDPVILGHAGEFSAGASVAGNVFERFEAASGEHNAHETLEETDEDSYEGFEAALGDLRETLEAEDLDAAHEALHAADGNLRGAQGTLAGSEAVKPLTLLVLGAHVEDAAMLATTGTFGEAAHEFDHMATKFEESGMREMLADVDGEAAETFADALEAAAAAADEEDAETARSSAAEAFEAAAGGLYALVPEGLAGAAHLAALQARGWDAAALARVGGPDQSFAHAAALNSYRMRAQDAVRLYELGEDDAAAAAVEDTLAQFEEARAHEALEEADQEAYERFEDEGLAALAAAIEADDPDAVEAAVRAVEAGVTDGVEALGTGDEPALIEAGYLKARIEDAVGRYRLGNSEAAAAAVESVFERFEGNSADLHETLEETDESLYERFEEEHLSGLVTAIEESDDDAVDEHAAGVRETLLSFETAAGSRAQVSAVESGYVAAQAFDAGVLATAGDREGAAAAAETAFGHFESGAGGFHESLEAADEDSYETFEAALESVGTAARDDGDVTAAARQFGDRAADAIYAVVSAAGGSVGPAAAAIVQEAFGQFEEARVHELLEEADEESYEAFEATLEEYIGALDDGSGVDAAAERFATAALRAQFAVAGAPDAAPVDEPGDGGEDDDEETDLEGGPNVVESVPDDADHVVEMRAVAFEPAELTVAQGETVAWRYAAGEPHSVTAYEEEIPEDAPYWASGAFESEAAAREGWENGRGAVQSGEAYVHTFETTGEHGYVCIPHEAAGMVGTVVVE